MNKKHAMVWTARGIAVGVALLNVASAQETAASVDEKDAAPVELDATDEVEVSPQEMLALVPEMLNRIRTADKTVEDMLSTARGAGDVSMVLCLDPFAGEIQIARNAAEDRERELKDAFERDDMTRARFSFNLLTVVRDRVNIVLGQANGCVGEETGFTGDSAIEIEIDPSLPEPEADLIPNIPAIIVVEPNVESASE